MKSASVTCIVLLAISPFILRTTEANRSYLKAIRSLLGSVQEDIGVESPRDERQLIGVHIFEHPKNSKKKKNPGGYKPLAKDLHGGHGIHGGGGYGHQSHGGGYGHDSHGGGGHGSGYGSDHHSTGYGHGGHGGGYKEPPKKIKPSKYHGPRYSPYDLVAPDKSKKGKLKYGDDPVSESKKGAYHRKKYDKPIKHFGGFGGGGSIGYNAGSLKGHGGGYGGGSKGHGGHGGGGGGYKGHGGGGGGGYKGHGGHGGGGGYKGHGGGGYKGHGGGGEGYKGHGGGGGGYKGHGGSGGGYKGHGGGGGGHKGHGGGYKGHGGGHNGHLGGYKGGGHKPHGGGYGGHNTHGGGYGGHGGGNQKGKGGHKFRGSFKKGLEGLRKGLKSLKGGHKGMEHFSPHIEYVILDQPPVYQHLKSPYNTYDAHANVRTTEINKGKGIDVSHMLLSDPYTSATSKG